MRIRVSKKAILAELKALKSFQGSNPLFRSFHLQADTNNRLKLMAIAGPSKLTAELEVDVVRAGSTWIQKQKFMEVVSSLNGTDFAVECGTVAPWVGKVMIEDDDFTARLSEATPESSYSELTQVDRTFTMSPVALKDLLKRISFALPGDNVSYAAMQLELGADKHRLISTNGHCLAITERTETASGELVIGLGKAIYNQLDALLWENPAESIVMSIGKIHNSMGILVTAGGRVLQTPVQQLTFPDYNRIVPSTNNAQCAVRSKDFLASLRMVSAAAEEGDIAVNLEFTNGLVSISYASGKQKAVKALDAETSGLEKAFSVRVNSGYLKTIITQCGDDAIFLLNTEKEMAPFIIKPKDQPDRYILAPMKR